MIKINNIEIENANYLINFERSATFTIFDNNYENTYVSIKIEFECSALDWHLPQNKLQIIDLYLENLIVSIQNDENLKLNKFDFKDIFFITENCTYTNNQILTQSEDKYIIFIPTLSCYIYDFTIENSKATLTLLSTNKVNSLEHDIKIDLKLA